MDKTFKMFVIVSLILLASTLGFFNFIFIREIQSMQVITKGENSVPDLAMFDLGEPILTNLSSESKYPRYTKVAVTIGVDQSDKKFISEFTTQVQEDDVVIRNKIIEIISSQKYEDMASPDYKETLAVKIVEELNPLLDTDKIIEAYFREFMVQ